MSGAIDPHELAVRPRPTGPKCDRAVRRGRHPVRPTAFDHSERVIRHFEGSSRQDQPAIIERVGIHGAVPDEQQVPRHVHGSRIRVEQPSSVWAFEMPR